MEAAAASGQFTGLAENADQTGQSIAEAFTINSDFKPAVDGITSGWSDLNSQVAGTKPLLESNFSLNDSIAGKIEEQTQGIGNFNQQLEVSKDLEELINDIKTVRAEKEKEAAAKQAERQAELRTNLELDLEILKAQISGNEQEEKAVQFKKDYNSALKQAIDAGMGKSEAEAFADQIARARREQAGINKELSTSQSLLKSIKEAESKDSVDRGGRLEKRAQDQIQRGNFAGARNTANQIAQNEIEASIRGSGQNMDGRSMGDIGKDFGLSQQLGENLKDFAARVKDVREGRAVAEKFGKSKKLPDPSVDRPGQDGKSKEDTGKDKPATIESLVLEIKKFVEKIEGKLPMTALA